MEVSELLLFVERVGVSGAIAFFVLIRLGKAVDRVTERIDDLVKVLRDHIITHRG